MWTMIDLSLPVDFFKKRAKEFLAQVKAGDPDAIRRVRRVFKDAVEKQNDALAVDFGLQRAQHVVAVEHGYLSWEALTSGSAIEARLVITMDKVPELNDFGIGLFYDHYKKPKAEQQAILEQDRVDLRKSVARVEATVDWLKANVQPTKTINKRHTSYGLKHLAEPDIDYITNGVFIAAGIIAGYPYAIVPGSPNVPFGMSEKSLRDVAAQRTHPERVLKRFTPMAVAILQGRGIQAHPASGGTGNALVWSEDGDVRTLLIGCAEKTPFLVRLFLDHYSVFVSRKVARSLGLSGGYYAQAEPTRPKAEITLLPDEVQAGLAWALPHDARRGALPPPPPFERTAPRPGSAMDTWSYMWSARALEAYRRGAKRRGPQSNAALAP
jgi:hypothetical protein